MKRYLTLISATLIFLFANLLWQENTIFAQSNELSIHVLGVSSPILSAPPGERT